MIVLVLIKICVTVFVVIGLSIVAEKISPRWAGLFAGYPTGTAISLFFFGFEISPQFAATSVSHNILGLIASLIFVYVYYLASLRYSIIPTLGLTFLAYGSAVTVLHYLPLNTPLAVIITIPFIIFFNYLFKPIRTVTINNRVKLRFSTLLVRGLSAAGIIILVTGAAHFIGPAWSGLFSSFPSMNLPLLLIIHLTYNTTSVHTIIKYIPAGNVAIVLYSLTVAFTYPRTGIYLGTIMSFAVATLYLFIYQHYKKQPA